MTERTRAELMQQASRGLQMLQLTQCAVCGTIIGWQALTMPDGDYQMTVRLVRIAGHCALPATQLDLSL